MTASDTRPETRAEYEAESWLMATAVVNLCGADAEHVAGVADYLTEKLTRLRQPTQPEARRPPAGDWTELIQLIMAGYVKEAGTKAEAMASHAFTTALALTTDEEGEGNG